MISAKEMRIVEENTPYFGVSIAELMENAGKNIFFEMEKRFKLNGKKVVVLCGQGNNGGDGFVLARHLENLCDVKVIFLGERNKLGKESAGNLKKLKKKMVFGSEKLNLLNGADFIVDAMLGTGVRGEIREPYASAIRKFNSSKAKKIAIDLPSGMDSDSGLGKLIAKADVIYCLHSFKKGLGKLKKKAVVIDIGIPKKASAFSGPGDLKEALGKREAESHKGDNGRLLIVAGSIDFVGAASLATLAAAAALRTGTDLVLVAAPREVALTINTYLPDIITLKMDGDWLGKKHIDRIMMYENKVDAILIGPGLGQKKETIDLVKEIVKRTKKPLILDADAIKAVKGMKFKGNVLLTPHSTEFGIFSGRKVGKGLGIDEKEKIVREVAKKHKCCMLLKGKIDVISDGAMLKFNDTGNAGMTVGGTGDVLSGLCGAFASMGNPLFESASAAAFLNGLAGDRAFRKKGYGLIGSDLLEELPLILKNI